MGKFKRWVAGALAVLGISSVSSNIFHEELQEDMIKIPVARIVAKPSKNKNLKINKKDLDMKRYRSNRGLYDAKRANPDQGDRIKEILAGLENLKGLIRDLTYAGSPQQYEGTKKRIEETIKC